MKIGAALADARWRAHLTVDEVSHQTRIREAIIWGIEQDDFSACGGDAYARGHIRALAQAVGIDAGPLIQQYDETYRTSEPIEDVVNLKPPPSPSPPGRPPRSRRRGALAASATLGVVVLALVAWAIYHVASGVGRPQHDQALAASGHQSSQQASGAAAGQGSPEPTPSSASPSASPIPSPSPTHTTPAVPASRDLSVVGAVPFGPGGEGTGDNPQSADQAIDRQTSTGWQSDWYTSAALGNLKSGTGLLLDLGHRYTVTDAELNLGGYYGADIQVRAGNEASLDSLPEVASASGAGGTVRLDFKSPARARYILIWFTQLPPDGSGTYQATVDHVIIRGRS